MEAGTVKWECKCRARKWKQKREDAEAQLHRGEHRSREGTTESWVGRAKQKIVDMLEAHMGNVYIYLICLE